MAIESVIELKINGIEQLDELERRLAGLRDGSINLGGAGGGTGGSTNVTINEYTTHMQQSRNDIHSFSRGLQSAANSLGSLTSGFVKLSKAILGTGGLISGVTSMATIAGMLKTAQNINQAAFMTNAIGVNPNDLARLKATYGQVFNVESVYSQVARERAAPYSMLMSQMGISQQQAQMMSPEDLLLMTHQHARRMAMQYGANELALKAGGLEGVMSVDDLLRELNLSPGQLREIEQSRQSYRSGTQLQNPEDWQRFARMMSLGTQNVGASMQNLVRPLLDPVFNVFNEFFNRVFGAQNQRMWEGAVDTIRQGLTSLAEFIKSGTWEELKDKMKNTFSKELERLSDFLSEKFRPAMEDFSSRFAALSPTIDQFMSSFRAFGIAIEGMARTLFEKGGPLESWKEEKGFGLRRWKEQIGEKYSEWKGEGKMKSLEELRPYAERVGARHGINPDFLLAQAAQETGFGRSVRGFNYFNITAGKGYQGASRLGLDKDAQGRTITQRFRTYENPEEAFEDAAKLMERRYSGTIGAEDIETYSRGLKGWAADPQYAAHVRERYFEIQKSREKMKASAMTGNANRAVYGNTRVDVNVNAPASADTMVQTSRTPGAINTMPR